MTSREPDQKTRHACAVDWPRPGHQRWNGDWCAGVEGADDARELAALSLDALEKLTEKPNPGAEAELQLRRSLRGERHSIDEANERIEQLARMVMHGRRALAEQIAARQEPA